MDLIILEIFKNQGLVKDLPGSPALYASHF